MIIDKKEFPNEIVGNMTDTFFNIKQENLAHIFGILRGNLYSNKHSAIIREYCTNANDAHVEAGIPDRPIEICVPTQFCNQFTVRDYGMGLSESDVENVFASYGASTKRGTNSQVGMLGIGSKSAFCYVDSFTIISYHDGMKKTYNAFIDESGIGKISKFLEEPTNETGLEIQIAIKQHDNYNFRYQIKNTLRFMNPVPKIVNDKSLEEELRDYTFFIENDKWAIGSYIASSRIVLVMGNITYPVNLNSLDLTNDVHRVFQNQASNEIKSVIIKAGIGSVKPSASRESLEYDKQTSEYLQTVLTEIKNSMQEEVDKLMLNCNSTYDARKLFTVVNNSFRSFGIVPEYKGRKIASQYIQLREVNISHKRTNYDDGWTVSTRNLKNIIASDNTYIFATYCMSELSARKRAEKWCDDNGVDLSQSCHIITLGSHDDYIEFISHDELVGANVINLNDVTIDRKPRAKQGLTVKSSAYKFLDRASSKSSDYWEPVEVDYKNGSGFYIPILRYEPVKSHLKNNSDLSSFIFYAKGVDIDVVNTVYGIRASDVSKLGDGWIEICSYVKTEFQRLVESTLKHEFDSWIIRDIFHENEINLIKQFQFTKPEHIEIQNACNNIIRYTERRYHNAFWAFSENIRQLQSIRLRSLREDIMSEFPVIPILARGSYLSERDLNILKQFIQG